MTSSELITVNDLDEIGRESFASDRPMEIATALVDAVERGRLENQADSGYALTLAAEITDRCGDTQAAEVLAARAVEAYRVHDDPDYAFPRAFHAELLLRLGREEQAMAQLSALRPLLLVDPGAVSCVSEALEGGGRAEVAVRWLTAALTDTLRRRQEMARQQAESFDESAAMVFALALTRHRIRRELELSHDEQDDLAEQLRAALHTALGIDEQHTGIVPMLFWPEAEFARLLRVWPVLAAVYGQTWDEHRTSLELSLVVCAETGPEVALLAGAVDGLASYAERTGQNPTDQQTRRHYVHSLHEQSFMTELIWPPSRGEACWCGSGLTYRECCLSRARP